MKKNLTLLLTVVGVIWLQGCKKDVEKLPLEQYTLDVVFDSMDSLGINAGNYLNDIYSVMQGGHNRVGGDYLDAATDDAITSASGNTDVSRLALGSYSASQLVGGENVFERYYNGIRRATIFLNNINVVPVKTKLTNGNPLKNSWKAEARFLRAYFYFELLKRYGGIPLLGDKVGQINDDFQLPRNSFEECVNFIVGECDLAKDSLRTYPVTNPAQFAHVVTKGAALALKARVLLYAASPLYNGGNVAAGNNLTGYAAFNAERWKRAADAAKELIDLGSYSLVPSFKNVFITANNAETILVREAGPSTSIEANNAPIGYSTNASGRTSPTQELVDAYPMKNGMMPGEAGSGYMPTAPYANRDPRLTNTILYNGSQWLNAPLETFQGGRNRPGGPIQQTRTGYYLRKFMGNFENSNNFSNTVHDFIIFRYAEVLLNYAEALNEYAGPSDAVYQVLKDIRKRGGIDAGTDGNYGLKTAMTADEMRTVLHNERRIELAFEEHRYFDIRRWKIAPVVMNNPLHGMLIQKSGTGALTYNVVEVFDPVFIDPKMFFAPIPYDEVVKNNNMIQNPGW